MLLYVRRMLVGLVWHMKHPWHDCSVKEGLRRYVHARLNQQRGSVLWLETLPRWETDLATLLSCKSSTVWILSLYFRTIFSWCTSWSSQSWTSRTSFHCQLRLYLKLHLLCIIKTRRYRDFLILNKLVCTERDIQNKVVRSQAQAPLMYGWQCMKRISSTP
jgi:hypothetical protein